MAENSFLGGLVVRRAAGQDGVYAIRVEHFHFPCHFAGVVAPNAGNHQGSARILFHGKSQNFFLLFF